MTRLLSAFLTILTLTLAGCGEESTVLPVDGRDIDGVNNSTAGTYSGVVIDGYLRNARVWLDIDGDYQYSPGPLEVELESGVTITLENGEPTTMTGAGGQFTLDTSELIRDPLEARNLDPRDYALVVVVVPGQTEEETRNGNVVLTRAYMMSAPPGTRNVTPLTSLLHSNAALGTALLDIGNPLALSLTDINLQADYLRAGDERSHAYARALARFLASQFPDYANAGLGDGSERVLGPLAINLLRLSYVRNAREIIGIVDAAVTGGSYANVDADGLTLPDVPLDLEDPVILRRQQVQAFGTTDEGLPTETRNLLVSSLLTYQYNPAGQLLEISANGCMTPSMSEMVRLANQTGRISETDTEGLPGVSLAQVSRQFYLESGIDERLSFDWAARRATFETRTTCHGSLADASELGGEPEVTYSWQMEGGRVVSITDGERTLTPDYTNDTSAYFGYTLSAGGDVLETVAVNGPIASCEGSVSEENSVKDRVISAQQPFAFSGYAPQPDRFSDPVLDWDIRDGAQRLLRLPFLQPDIDENGSGLEWEFAYTSAQTAVVVDQPNLITNATLSEYGGARTCGTDATETSSTKVYAYVDFDYSSLSEYLIDQTE